MMTMIFEIFLS